ncbi:hypothetical protein LTR84_004648 [Exophiala bonariae]|uniref:Alcohol dehydrogenase-like C-terminal domain-containing protein n=1 Tax=Exophiala bonariae TaxID=1690606 RepID=A0AAV9NMX9_9EURO|nr:hypothetical protein LTR84_004648 [Exophiala bonariae]
MMSVQRNGAFQEYLVVDSTEASRIPDEMAFETAAPLACAGITIWRGILQAELRPGQWLGIVGSGGGLGHLGIQFAKARGLKVIGVDARDEGIALSREAGADVVLDARFGKEDVARRVFEATGGKGADATLNVSDAKLAAATACAITKNHGTMVQMALPPEVSIPFSEYIFRDIRVKGSFLCSQKEAEDMLRCVVEHNIKIEKSIFHGLDQVPTAVEMLKTGGYRGKGVIIVDGSL